jgi:Protein of unknown function (DUF2867)
MKVALIVRNRIASFLGLDAPTASEILNIDIKSSYSTGEKIGVWPIFSLTETELVAGRDNKYLDFRLSRWHSPTGAILKALPRMGCSNPESSTINSYA